MMQDYKLYKGAWIYAGNLSQAKKLTDIQLRSLLNGGVNS